MPDERRRLRLPGIILLGAGLLLLAAVVFGFWGRWSERHGALQRYEAELRARGEKLTWAELPVNSLTNDGRGMVRLTAAAHQLTNLAPGNLSPGSLAGTFVTGATNARVVWRAEGPIAGPTGTTPWNWSLWAKEIEAQNGPLEEIRQALEDPPAGGGPQSNPWAGLGASSRKTNGLPARSGISGTPIADFVALRTVAQWLMGVTLSELHQGRIPEAARDLEAMTAVGQVNREDYTLVAQMIRVAIVGLDLSVTWQALQADGWTDAELRPVQERLQEIDLFAGLEQAFLGERALEGEFAELLRHHPTVLRQTLISTRGFKPSLPESLADDLLLPIYRLTSLDRDELQGLRGLQWSVEQVRDLRAGQGWAKVKLRAPPTNAPPRAARMHGAWFWMGQAGLPNAAKALGQVVRVETQRRLAVTALALTRYRLHDGNFPATLTTLVPEFLPVAPRDPMSGAELRYHLQPDGTFLLYSVGEDGRDDSGDPLYDQVWPAAAGPGSK